MAITLSTDALHAEIARREKDAKKLNTQRDQLLNHVEKIDNKLALLERGSRRRLGRTTRRGTSRRTTRGTTGTRRRSRNKVPLPDAIAGAMDKGAVVSPKEAAALVKANGYKTTSKTFNVSVSQTLAKDKRFKRVGRGQYERVA